MTHLHRMLLATVTLPFALGACDSRESEPVEAPETTAAPDTGTGITNEQIEEAVPGVENVDAEGDTPNTADLRDSENVDPVEENEADDFRQ